MSRRRSHRSVRTLAVVVSEHLARSVAKRLQRGAEAMDKVLSEQAGLREADALRDLLEASRLLANIVWTAMHEIETALEPE